MEDDERGTPTNILFEVSSQIVRKMDSTRTFVRVETRRLSGRGRRRSSIFPDQFNPILGLTRCLPSRCAHSGRGVITIVTMDIETPSGEYRRSKAEQHKRLESSGESLNGATSLRVTFLSCQLSTNIGTQRWPRIFVTSERGRSRHTAVVEARTLKLSSPRTLLNTWLSLDGTL